MDFTHLAQIVTTALPSALIESLADQLGVVRRRRRIPIAPLVYTLVLATLCDKRPGWAALHRRFVAATGRRVARSSFYERLTEPLARLIAELCRRALMRARRRRTAHPLESELGEPFARVLALDSCSIALRASMRSAMRSCQKLGAGFKIHTVCNALTFEPHRVRLSAQAAHDEFGARDIRRWCKGALVLMDLGYYSFEAFWRISSSGGFFVSRAKSSFNARIVKDLGRGPGRRARIVGLKWKQALKATERAELDAIVELVWYTKSRAGRVRHTLLCRAVSIRGPEGKVWTYLTNLGDEEWSAGEIGDLYRLRWSVELLFRSCQSGAGLDWQPSAKEHLVRLRVDATLLGLALCGRLCARARRARPGYEASLARGLAAFQALGAGLLEALCAPWSWSCCALEAFVDLAIDPNLARPRSRDVLTLNSRLADAA